MTAYQKVVAPSGAIGYAAVPHGSASLILGRLAVAPDPSRSLIVEDPEGRIGRLVISYGISGDPGGAGMSGSRELIDTVVIRESEEPPPPPEDTTDPVVDITGPEQDSSVPHRTVHVPGYVDEDVGLERVIAQHGLRDTALACTGMPPRFFFAGTVQLEEGSGRRSIAVYAEDLFGNSGRQTVKVDYEPVEYTAPPTPPPPNLDLVALGMEVTQAIKGWGMVGETRQDVDNRTRLVAGKRTLVRVYAEARGVDVSIPDVRCDLRAYRGAAELPGSPLGSLNRVALEPGETHLEQRPVAEKSFNFFLPPEWTAAGSVRFLATVNPWNGAGERLGAFDAYNDAVRDVNFNDTEEL